MLAAIMAKPGYYRIKVSPRQPHTKFLRQLADGTIKIAIAAPPEQGKANAELLRYLSEELKIVPARLRIASGLTSPLKVIYLDVHS